MPGVGWRILAHTFPSPDDMSTATHEWNPGPGVFDELVVPGVIRVEQMDLDVWWVNVGPLHITVTVGEDGEACSVVEWADESWLPSQSQRPGVARWNKDADDDDVGSEYFAAWRRPKEADGE